jgi:TolB-like protein/Flp pilus assembly protein TadD
MTPRSLQFSSFTLDLDRMCLLGPHGKAELRPKSFEVLRYLVEHAGRVIAKEEVIEAVWPNVTVTDESLTRCISEVRRAIGDGSQEIIKTVPRRGYLLDVPVSAGDVTAMTAPPPPICIAERVSITVLPFTNMSDNPNHEHFVGGLAEDITTALSRCNWLLVIARNSWCTNGDNSSDGRQIGHTPRANYELGGTVRCEGSCLRVTIRLVDALSGVQIWADRFDGDTCEIFRVQDRITAGVVAAIEPRLEYAELRRLKHKPFGELDAYELVLWAHKLENEYTEQSITQAIRYLKQAMTMDPSYAPAMATAAFCYTERRQQGWSTNPEEDTDEGLRLAIRALEIGQHDPRVLWMGSLAVRALGADSHRGRELASRSLQLNPNSTMALANAGYAELVAGNPIEALGLLGRAERLSPHDLKSWYIAGATALACFATAQYERAVCWSNKALAQNPRFAPSMRTLAASLAKLRRMDEAAQVVLRILNEDPHTSVADVRWKHRQMHESVLSPWLEGLRLAGLPR